MNIDTKILFNRYIIASYGKGKGSSTVRDTITRKTRVVSEELMPTDEEGFAALFTPVNNLRR